MKRPTKPKTVYPPEERIVIEEEVLVCVSCHDCLSELIQKLQADVDISQHFRGTIITPDNCSIQRDNYSDYVYLVFNGKKEIQNPDYETQLKAHADYQHKLSVYKEQLRVYNQEKAKTEAEKEIAHAKKILKKHNLL